MSWFVGVLRFACVLITLLLVTILSVELSDLFFRNQIVDRTLIVLIVLTAIFVALVRYIGIWHSQTKKLSIERTAIKYAIESAEAISALELAAQCEIGIKESMILLDKFHAMGVCEKSSTDKGVYLYRFELPTAQAKLAAFD